MTEQALATVTKGPFRASLFHDSDAESPREWDTIGTMTCWHRRYTLGDEQPSETPDQWWEYRAAEVDSVAQEIAANERDEAQSLRTAGLDIGSRSWMQEVDRTDRVYRLDCRTIFEREHVALNLYLMDHSGISMKTTSFGDPWDSGQVGIIWVHLPSITPEQHGLDNPTEHEVREWAKTTLENEVRAYDQFLRGDVYHYLIEDAGDEVVGACGGFYGYDYALSQMNEELNSLILGLGEGSMERQEA